MTEFPLPQDLCDGRRTEGQPEAAAPPVFFAERAATRAALLLRARQPSRERGARDRRQRDRHESTSRSAAWNLSRLLARFPTGCACGTTSSRKLHYVRCPPAHVARPRRLREKLRSRRLGYKVAARQ